MNFTNLINLSVIHYYFGKGIVSSIRPGCAGNMIICVDFGSKGIKELSFPDIFKSTMWFEDQTAQEFVEAVIDERNSEALAKKGALIAKIDQRQALIIAEQNKRKQARLQAEFREYLKRMEVYDRYKHVRKVLQPFGMTFVMDKEYFERCVGLNVLSSLSADSPAEEVVSAVLPGYVIEYNQKGKAHLRNTGSGVEPTA